MGLLTLIKGIPKTNATPSHVRTQKIYEKAGSQREAINLRDDNYYGRMKDRLQQYPGVSMATEPVSLSMASP